MVDRLLEVTLAIEETDANEAEAEIAGGLRVVARQDAEAAGGDRQRLVKPKLGCEVGDGMLQQRRSILSAPGVDLVQVTDEGLQDVAHALGEFRILQTHAQFVVGNFVQDCDGVVIQVLPAARRKVLENLLCFLVPGPPKIASEAIEAHDQVGQLTLL